MRRAARTPKTALPSTKLIELGFAAPQVIAHRVARMALAGPTPNARDRQEFVGMIVEKQAAFAQAWTAAFVQGLKWQQQIALSLMTGATPKQHAAKGGQAASRAFNATLTPIHRKATANAKRLARTKLR
jgi:hypothetical protein